MPKTLTAEEFIERAKDVHSGKANYDYSRVEYVNNRTRVEIICKINGHGSFPQSPDSHLRGTGCPKCGFKKRAESNRISHDEFLEKCVKVHGGAYDYSKVVLHGMKEKVQIKCNTCLNEFTQKACMHILGQGCLKCSRVKVAKKNRLGRNKFISRSLKIHNGAYSYDEVVYKTQRDHVTIYCKSCDKTFRQAPTSHLQGTGCPDCGRTKAQSARRLTTDAFLKKLKKRTSKFDNYDFSEFEYRGTHEKTTVTCERGHTYQARPNDLFSEYGCFECAGKSKLTTDEFIMRSRLIHPVDNFLYDKTVYSAIAEKVIITCKMHGDFTPIAGNFLRGSGCPSCAQYGFDKKKPANMYYLKIKHNGDNLYKIGITNNDAKERFRNPEDKEKIEIIETFSFMLGEYAYRMEQVIINTFFDSLAGSPNILDSGNTEIFNNDVLGLDNG